MTPTQKHSDHIDAIMFATAEKLGVHRQPAIVTHPMTLKQDDNDVTMTQTTPKHQELDNTNITQRENVGAQN